MRRLIRFSISVALVLVAHPAFAQSDSGGPIAQIRDYVERINLVEKLNPEEGIYARVGGLTTGSGLALGGGYRTRKLWGRPVDVSGVLSTKLYKELAAKVQLAAFGADRVEIWTTAKW